MQEYDGVCTRLASEGCNVIMIIKNAYNRAALDMIAPGGRSAGNNCYAFNVDEQVPTEKLEALLSFWQIAIRVQWVQSILGLSVMK